MLKLRLKEVLAQKKMTYFQLYTKSHIAESTLSRIASGKQSPSLEMISRIAEALDCSIEELLVMDSSYIECPHCHKLIKVEVKK